MAEANIEVDAEEIEREAEITTAGVGKRRGRKRQNEELPQELGRLSGSEVIRILDFLHRRYLSWMVEAEGAKYTSVYKTAREEALKDVMETYAEIQKQNNQLLERMEKLIQALEGKLTAQPTIIAQQTAEQLKRSIFDDPRVRSMIFIGLESLFGNNPNYQRLRDFIISVLFPEAVARQQGEAQGAQA